jgi:hypothetical protein
MLSSEMQTQLLQMDEQSRLNMLKDINNNKINIETSTLTKKMDTEPIEQNLGNQYNINDNNLLSNEDRNVTTKITITNPKLDIDKSIYSTNPIFKADEPYEESEQIHDDIPNVEQNTTFKKITFNKPNEDININMSGNTDDSTKNIIIKN